MKKEMSKASRIMPCSVNLLTVGTKTEREAMTATAMFVSENPPLFVVSVQKHITAHGLIEKTGEFVLNVASIGQVKLAKQLGMSHDKVIDKFKEYGIATENAATIESPVIKGSFANIECKVITSFTAGRFTVYVAEAINFAVDEKAKPMIWDLNRYYALGEEVR
jgi:flavin reductase (DIM6/NTAB) family NADH-FMN oxidoreductase RutF